MTSPPKLLYVAHRQPRFTPEAFTARWRQHAALGMSQARWRNVARYVHCDAIAGLPDPLPRLDADGVAIVVWHSEQARQAHIGDEAARRTMKADELDTFAQPVAQSSVLTQARERKAGPAGAEHVLFVFWESEDPGFAHAWRAAGEPWAAAAGPEFGWVQNEAVAAGFPWACRGVDEVRCVAPQPLAELAGRWQAMLGLPGRAGMVLTRAVVLHEESGPLTRLG